MVTSLMICYSLRVLNSASISWLNFWHRQVRKFQSRPLRNNSFFYLLNKLNFCLGGDAEFILVTEIWYGDRFRTMKTLKDPSKCVISE